MIINIPEYKITYTFTKEEFDNEIKRLSNFNCIIIVKNEKEIIVCDTEYEEEQQEYIPIQEKTEEYIPTPIINHEDIIDPFQNQETGKIIITPPENTYPEEELKEEKPEIKSEEKYAVHKLGYIERKY